MFRAEDYEIHGLPAGIDYNSYGCIDSVHVSFVHIIKKFRGGADVFSD